MLRIILVVAYMAGCVAVALRQARARGSTASTLRGRARDLGWGILLLPLALMIGGLFTPATRTTEILLLLAGIVAVFWPAVAAKVTPVVLIGLGLYGFEVVRVIERNGQVPAGVYGLATTSPGWGQALILAQAWAFLAAGSWLAWRVVGRQSAIARVLFWEPRGGRGGAPRPRWGLLLLPVALMVLELLGRPIGPGQAGVILVLALIVLAPAVAADLVPPALIALGLTGMALALWPTQPGSHVNYFSETAPAFRGLPPYFRGYGFYFHGSLYGAVWVVDQQTALLAGAQGLALLAAGVWLVPRALDARTKAVFWPATEGRVQRLTQTRADAVDTAAAELRRVERDLHDGAQARLVALGMNLRAAERLITASPQAAIALVGEAIQTSSKALAELRDLVRGICPPVLADRGLPDAVRALALDTPLHTELDFDVPGRLDAPVESACYFAVAEALTNAVKHSGARHVQIRMQHARGMLRIEVTDDGAGGADPQAGSGLRGLERRLGTFDGILAVSSPPAGPTMIVIEVPCALSLLKTSSC